MLRYISVSKSLVLASGALCLPILIAAQNSVTPGQFQVTDAGAASYTIPLYTAPATGNLDVKLALQYNSQSGNGVFGVGWSFTGVSSITRCPKTIAEEGVRQGVKNDSSDIFCLDGQKLRNKPIEARPASALPALYRVSLSDADFVAGVQGAPGTKYRTAMDNYSSIESFGNQAGGPQYFKAYTKSGLIMEFGLDDGVNNSRLDHPVKGVGRVWMVNKISDRFNNEIKFGYYKNPAMGEQILTSVSHGNGRTDIQYVERPRNDWINKYDDGVQMGSTGLIANKIVVSDAPVVGGAAQQLRAFKEYRLTYTQSTSSRRSLLTSVQECVSFGACLPAVAISYQSTGVLGFAAGDVVGGGNNILVVDTNGKGKQEVIPNDPIKLFNLSSGFSGVSTGGIAFNPAPNSSVVAFDIDGDSKTDFQISFPKKDSYSYCSYTKYANGQPTLAGCGNSQYGVACFADLNGDGISETLYYGLSGLALHSPTYVTVNETLSNSIATRVLYLGNEVHSTTANDAVNNLARCRAVDLDGDGRAEIIVADKVLSYSNSQLQIHPLNLSTMALGDFNGDGKTDAITQQWTAASMWHGNGKFDSLSPAPQVSMPYGNYNFKSITCTGDFNGDGRTDLVTVPFGVVHIMLSNGNGFTDVVVPNIAVSLGSIHCGDFNGDGLTDLYVGNENRYYYNTLPSAVDALVNVNNGLGHSHQVQYKPITDDSIYTKYSDAAKPVVDLQTPIQVVWRVTEQTGASLAQSTNYRYEGLRADLHHRGTLGFAKVTSQNEGTGISMSTSYNQQHPLIGLKSSSQKTSRTGQLLETASYTYEARGFVSVDGIYSPIPANAGYARIVPVEVNTKRYDLNGAFLSWSRDTSSRIDDFGNVIDSGTSQLDASGVIIGSKSATNKYTIDIPRWLVGQLTSSRTYSDNIRDLPGTTVGSAANASGQSGNSSVPVLSPTSAELQAARIKAAMASILSLLLED